MRLWHGAVMGLRGLGANRLRSALTMLGILIGVTSVILMVALGNGASLQVQSLFESLGTNAVYVYPKGPNALTLGDVEALDAPGAAPQVRFAVPMVVSGESVTYGGRSVQAPVTGTYPQYASIVNDQLSAGALFTDQDVVDHTRTAVIGAQLVKRLFHGDPQAALGQLIQVQGQPFRIIGTLASKGGSQLGSQDTTVLVPVTSAWDYLTGGWGTNVSQIVIEAPQPSAVAIAEEEAEWVLTAEHTATGRPTTDFFLQSDQQILSSLGSASATFTILLGSIAAISLVVGGIGVMNIMLVTVSERTREIGIRKAIGARRRDILFQFLVEAMLLAGAGGVLGVSVGIGISLLLDHVSAHGSGFSTHPVVSPPSVVLSVAVSVGIGLFFGIYPASRAARLQPVEALRYE